MARAVEEVSEAGDGGGVEEGIQLLWPAMMVVVVFGRVGAGWGW